MLYDRADSEEIVQDVMLGLWSGRHKLAPELSLGAYLFRATRNRALNHLRHQKVQQRAVPMLQREEAVAATEDRGLVEREIQLALQSAMNELPPRCREVFELSRNQGLSYAEIAHALDISVKTVETQMSKALRVLRDRLARFIRPDGDGAG